MEKFVLDTGIILGYVRGAGYAEYIEKKYRLFSPPNIPLISIVSKGEIYSLALLTTDHDFDHLDGVFLTVTYIDQKATVADAK